MRQFLAFRPFVDLLINDIIFPAKFDYVYEYGSHINETLQTTKKRKNAAESKKSATTTSTKCQKLTNYFFALMHYRDPNIYKEMLTTIAELEKEKLKDEVNTAIKFSSQIDGSVDTMQRDNKFLFLKYNSPDEIKTRIVGVTDSDLKGAAGLEDCVLTGLKTIEVDKLVMKKKYAGVTTDGEAANTGSKSGLWKRLEDHVERKLMNFWRACHRSDLAMEDMEESVPELKVLKSNLLSIPEYYHKSATRTKELKTVLPTMKAFPTYHNVRFSQHLNNVCIAVLHNQVGCLQHWDNISKSRDYDARERKRADGFIKLWKKDGMQSYITCIVSDVCFVLQALQKHFQKVCIVLPDIMKHRDIALLKLRSMLDAPYAGGSEETWVKENGALDADQSGQSVESSRQAKRTHTLIGGYHRERPFITIRNEIINAAINFLEQRLDNEQEGIMKNIVDICGAKSIDEFVVASRPSLECAGIVGDDVKEFTDTVFEIFDDLKPNSHVLEKDYTVRILHMLR